MLLQVRSTDNSIPVHISLREKDTIKNKNYPMLCSSVLTGLGRLAESAGTKEPSIQV